MASEVKERLLEYLYYKRMTQVEFARKMGVSNAFIGAMRRSISDDKVKKLRKVFPDLNTSWLLYGEGEMLRGGAVARPYAEAEVDTPRVVAEVGADGCVGSGYEVPLLPVAAYAGNLQLWSEGVGLADCEKVVSPVRGADFAIRVSGDSMEPELHDGATILIKRINEKAFIPWGNKMVIDTENGVLVKNVFPSETRTGTIEARSLNPKYPPIEIPSASIYGLYRILGTVQVYTTL